jgi:hypothetical protein
MQQFLPKKYESNFNFDIFSKFARADFVNWLPAGRLHDGEIWAEADNADPMHPLIPGVGAAGHVQGRAHPLRRPPPHRLWRRNGRLDHSSKKIISLKMQK